MVIAFLLALNASSICIARTDICAPAGSTIDGTIGQTGGQVTITPSKPMTALGAEFRAGAKLTVNVVPWSSSDKTQGAIVHVNGELTKEALISGARVVGSVGIGQLQGRKAPPQLVAATDLKSGALTIGAGGPTIEVGPGMKITGHVDLGTTRFDVTSDKPIRAIGLELAPGTVRIEQRTNGITIGGMLTKPQSFGGVLVEQQLHATLEGTVPRFGQATLAAPTKLGVRRPPRPASP